VDDMCQRYWLCSTQQLRVGCGVEEPYEFLALGRCLFDYQGRYLCKACLLLFKHVLGFLHAEWRS
jgi:hypothetical protein